MRKRFKHRDMQGLYERFYILFMEGFEKLDTQLFSTQKGSYHAGSDLEGWNNAVKKGLRPWQMRGSSMRAAFWDGFNEEASGLKVKNYTSINDSLICTYKAGRDCARDLTIEQLNQIEELGKGDTL